MKLGAGCRRVLILQAFQNDHIPQQPIPRHICACDVGNQSAVLQTQACRFLSYFQTDTAMAQ